MTSQPHAPSDRRLSAIMFTDIVGYSALTQKNESRALRLLAEHNALLRPIFARHRGSEIKTIGDAFLVEFASALDAVQCSIDIQRTLSERNSDIGPDETIQLRIGIHLGDVVHEDGDVFGDGVNIASRIYPVAAPGGICLSEGVAHQVQNKLDYPLRKLPPHALKNISLPLDLFEIVLPWGPAVRVRPLLSVPAVKRISTVLAAIALVALALWAYSEYWSGARFPMNRVAVLPFRNISPLQDSEYFAEGMTEELISSLSRISGLEVIARSSTQEFTSRSPDFTFISEKLRAGSLVEGNVRHFGDSVRVTVRLIDAARSRLLWDDDFNRPAANALKIQDEIALNVAGALRVQLLETERADLTGEKQYDPDALRLYLLGQYHLNKRTSEDITKSVDYFTRALSIDSSLATSYTGLAEAYLLIAGAGYGSIPRDKALQEAMNATTTAMDLDPRLAEAYAVRGYLLYRLLWKWKEADSLFRRAIALKPSYARAYEWYGLYLSLKGNTAEGLAQMRVAASLDPHSASVATGVGRLLSFDRQYDESIRWLTQVTRDHPRYAEAYFALALAQTYAERYEASLQTFQQAIELSGRRDVIIADYAVVLALSGRTDGARAILRELDSLAQHRPVSSWVRGIVHVALGEYDAALTLLHQSLDRHEGLLVYVRTDPIFTEIATQDPRFAFLQDAIWRDQ